MVGTMALADATNSWLVNLAFDSLKTVLSYIYINF